MRKLKKQISDLETEIQDKQKELKELKEVQELQDLSVNLSYLKLANRIEERFSDDYPKEVIEYSHTLSRDILYSFLDKNLINQVMQLPIDFIFSTYYKEIKSKLDSYNLNYYIFSRR